MPLEFIAAIERICEEHGFEVQTVHYEGEKYDNEINLLKENMNIEIVKKSFKY